LGIAARFAGRRLRLPASFFVLRSLGKATGDLREAARSIPWTWARVRSRAAHPLQRLQFRLDGGGNGDPVGTMFRRDLSSRKSLGTLKRAGRAEAGGPSGRAAPTCASSPRRVIIRLRSGGNLADMMETRSPGVVRDADAAAPPRPRVLTAGWRS
jgi:hypothetical protein